MKRFLSLVFAAVWALSASAEVSYQLNGGVTNDYGWMDKNDMFQACMVDMGVVGAVAPLVELQSSYDPFTMICGRIPDVTGFLFEDSWEWLEHYILAVQDNDPDAYKLEEGDPENKGWKYAIAAFFLERQKISVPRTADFSQTGKIEAFQSAWKHGFDNPTNPTGEWVLNAPYKAGSTFVGWYASADFSGDKLLTIDASTTGTLYAKWVDNAGIENTYVTNNYFCAGSVYNWSISGEAYTQPGTYYAQKGSDLYVLNLELREPVYVDVYESACGSYLWNGISCALSGDYSYTTDASNGCDSVITLHLTIYEQSLPTSIALPSVQVGMPIDVTAAQADILAYIAEQGDAYAPNAEITWWVKQGDEWTPLTSAPVEESVSVVTLKYEIVTECGVISSDDMVIPIVTTDLSGCGSVSTVANKQLCNGRLVISHDGRTFNAQGVEIN